MVAFWVVMTLHVVEASEDGLQLRERCDAKRVVGFARVHTRERERMQIGFGGLVEDIVDPRVVCCDPCGWHSMSVPPIECTKRTLIFNRLMVVIALALVILDSPLPSVRVTQKRVKFDMFKTIFVNRLHTYQIECSSYNSHIIQNSVLYCPRIYT